MKRVLVIRFSSIGDIVLCSPVLRNLKTQFPNIQIDVLTKEGFASVWKNNPFIDRLLIWEDPESRRTWKNEHYDVIIDLHNNLRSKQVKWIRWDCPNISFSKENFKKMGLVWTKSNTFSATPINTRYDNLLNSIGISTDNLGLDFYGIDALPDNINLPDRYYAIALGGSYKTKQVPIAKYLEFLRTQKGDIPFVLLGGKADVSSAQQIKSEFPDLCIDFCGILSLGASANIVSRCIVLISGDTGLAHIAAALGKSVLWMWGSTSPKLGMLSPQKPNGGEMISMEVQGLKCRPCSKLGYSECPKEHFKCMDHNPQLWLENLEKLTASALG